MYWQDDDGMFFSDASLVFTIHEDKIVVFLKLNGYSDGDRSVIYLNVINVDDKAILDDPEEYRDEVFHSIIANPDIQKKIKTVLSNIGQIAGKGTRNPGQWLLTTYTKDDLLKLAKMKSTRLNKRELVQHILTQNNIKR